LSFSLLEPESCLRRGPPRPRRSRARETERERGTVQPSAHHVVNRGGGGL
jgi:hypothetical protein